MEPLQQSPQHKITVRGKVLRKKPVALPYTSLPILHVAICFVSIQKVLINSSGSTSFSERLSVSQEAILAAKFTEVNAVNKQRLQNLEFAQNLLRQVTDE